MLNDNSLSFGGWGDGDGYCNGVYIIRAKLSDGTRIRCLITDLVLADFPDHSPNSEHSEEEFDDLVVNNRTLFENIFQKLARSKQFRNPSDSLIGFDLVIDVDTFSMHYDSFK